MAVIARTVQWVLSVCRVPGEDEVAEMSKEQAIERLNTYWSTGG